MNNLTINLTAIGGGLLIVILGIPMMLGKVRPNRIYGFRTRRTLSDPDIWYPANRAAGLAMVVTGLAMAIATTGLMLLWKDISLDSLARVSLALWIAAIGGMTVYSFHALRRL
jgi:uncharacterized membrane protein